MCVDMSCGLRIEPSYFMLVNDPNTVNIGISLRLPRLMPEA